MAGRNGSSDSRLVAFGIFVTVVVLVAVYWLFF
jgi:hypothetical protein